MCGRIALTLPNDAMAQLFAAKPDNNLPDVPNFNVCPTTNVHVVTGGSTGRRLRAMRWGFVPTWYTDLASGPLLINARCETIAKKPGFRTACRLRRCLIPATGFYEWTKSADGTRLPWYISCKKSEPLAFAGIWQDCQIGDQTTATCAIVTVAASIRMQAIHTRMPLIIEQSHWGKWLGEEGKGAATLMKTFKNNRLSFHRVGMAVNSSRAAGAILIEPNIEK